MSPPPPQALLTKTLDKLNAQARVSSMSSMSSAPLSNSLTAFDGRSLDGTSPDEDGRGTSAYVMEPGWMSFPINDGVDEREKAATAGTGEIGDKQ